MIKFIQSLNEPLVTYAILDKGDSLVDYPALKNIQFVVCVDGKLLFKVSPSETI